MKIYYAHPIESYGSKQEAKDIESISELVEGCEVINPSSAEIQKEFDAWKKQKPKTEHEMRFFKRLVSKCDGVCFRGNTRGVQYEVSKAKEFEIPTFDLSDIDVIEESEDLK